MKGISDSIYSRRKRFLPEYREFLSALLKLPDPDVRARVINAVNDVPNGCLECSRKSVFKKTIATQTEDRSISGLESENILEAEIVEKIETMQTAVGEKRRRKRKRNCPKVVKTAQHPEVIPILKQENVSAKADTGELPIKVTRTNSTDETIDYFFKSKNPIFEFTQEQLAEQMRHEWEISGIRNNAGLLPIHEAIVQNEVRKLQRQLYVWNFRKYNLMDLLTDEGDNLIQLAVKENCLKPIIDELLKQDLKLDAIDDDNNTVIHLAVTHLTYDDVQKQGPLLETLESLLKKVDLKILLEKNNDGLTALHIAVKEDKYQMVEKILNVLDSQLHIKGALPLNKPLAGKECFISHYCKQCDNFERCEQNELKDEIINATDMKSGSTALFLAMEHKYDHIIYLLLAHMCNPTIKNLSGMDAKTYYAEFGKNPSITGALEKLATALEK